MSPFALPPIPQGSILGINYSGMHDSAIALVGPDGAVLFALSLERITREKQDGRPPDALLENMPWDKIAYAAISTNESLIAPQDPYSKIHPLPLAHPRATGVAHGAPFDAFLARLPVPKRFVCHQLAHAASAFYLSAFEDALCLTYDGGMNNCAWFGGLYQGRGTALEALDRFSLSHHARISILYTDVTALLGFTPNKHEGKITGLAARGTPSEACRAFLQSMIETGAQPEMPLSEWYFMYDAERPPVMVVNEARRMALAERAAAFTREELAATVQAMAEEHVLSLLHNAQKQGWTSSRICLSGGLFANVRINQRVRELGFTELFVSPPMTDDGTALGAALQTLAEDGKLIRRACTTMALGPAYAENDIERVLASQHLVFTREAEPAQALARLLAEGKSVAVFQGAMEFGPRALGQRSILASASEAGINQRLNDKLNRTEFMPFAPMTLQEEAADCYLALAGVEQTAQFMTLTLHCTAPMAQSCPAVVHVDGTARPQLITREHTPFIHEVLSAYQARTGHGTIVNTSFNIHEEPIVCTPQDAVDGFLQAGLDALYLHPGYLLLFEANHAAALQSLQVKRVVPSRKALGLAQINACLFSRMETMQTDMHTQQAALGRQDEVLSKQERLLRQQDEQLRRQDEILREQEDLLRKQDEQLRALQTAFRNKSGKKAPS